MKMGIFQYEIGFDKWRQINELGGFRRGPLPTSDRAAAPALLAGLFRGRPDPRPRPHGLHIRQVVAVTTAR